MEESVKNKVLAIARLLDEHKAEDTMVLNVANSWTDFFIITTVRSQVHLKGLVRRLADFFAVNHIEALNRHKNVGESGWVLIDCGEFVVHLMDKEMRSFYELEKLWFNSSLIYQSSKSS